MRQIFNLCGDNSCIFGPPAGQGTNGGCRCFEALRDERQYKGKQWRAIVSRVLELKRYIRTIENTIDRYEGIGPKDQED